MREKTDRRSKISEERLKRSFLAMKRRKRFHEITISELCREAGVSRGTFYLHFRNTAEVLDSILEDAMREIKGVLEQVRLREEKTVCCGKVPLCHFIRENSDLHCIFMDEELMPVIARKMADRYERQFIETIGAHSSLTPEQLKMLFYFQLSGCLEVSRLKMREPKEEWCADQRILDRFIHGGYGAF